MIPVASPSGKTAPRPRPGRTAGRSGATMPAIRRASRRHARPIFSRCGVSQRCCGGTPARALSRRGLHLLGLAQSHSGAVELQQARRVELKADRTAWFGTRRVGMRTHDHGAAAISKRHVHKDIGAEILDAGDDAIEPSIPGCGYPDGLRTKREMRRVVMNARRKRCTER